MERKIKLEFVDKTHYWMKGIYLIRIGRMRYVGKALLIGNRIYQHQLEINRTLSNYADLVNVRDEWSKLRSYIRLAKYLHENPKIESGSVEVLERQICSHKLYDAENSYLKDIEGNGDFYNSSYCGSRPKHDEDNLWDVVENNGVLEYFDPRISHLKVSSNKNNNQNKDTITKINEVKQSRPYKMQRLGEVRERLLGANPSLELRKAVNDYSLREIAKM